MRYIFVLFSMFFAISASAIPLNLNYVMTEDDITSTLPILGPVIQADVNGTMTLNAPHIPITDFVLTINTTTPVSRSDVTVSNFTLDFLDEPYVFDTQIPRGFQAPIPIEVTITSASFAFTGFQRPLGLDLRFQRLLLGSSLTLVGSVLLDDITTPFSVVNTDPIIRLDGRFDPDFVLRTSKLTLEFFGGILEQDVVSQIVDGDDIDVHLGFVMAFEIDPLPAPLLPEPGIALLLGTGLIGLLIIGRKK